MKIITGKLPGGIKIGIYGPEGVGKTTFASKAEGVVFLDTEGGTKQMDVARVAGIDSWADIIGAADYFISHPDELKTLVIDTMDWAERMAGEAVCEEKHWKNLEDAGYGKGYVFLKQRIQELLDKLSQLADKGVNIILIAHSTVRKFEQPDEMGAYDRYTLKLNEKNVAPIVREWLDALFFVNYKTDVVKSADGKTTKARGGQKRVMYANHTAAFDAKNRFGLPDEMPFDFDQVAHILASAEPAKIEPKQTIEDVLNTQPIQIPEQTATVTVAATLPKEATGKKAKKAAPAAPDRPESMKSDNPEKDKLLAQVWELMRRNAIPDPLIIQSVVAEKEYYDLAVPIKDYEADFIEGCLIEAWDIVNGLAQTKIHDLPF